MTTTTTAPPSTTPRQKDGSQGGSTMKDARIDTVWRGTEVIEVPDDWEWDGTLESLLEFTDVPADNVELVDWKVTVKA
jgi:hypothetical protein